ncbi:nitrogen regulatory protein PII [Candidatus Scalindua japonica]|uniref:Nitrogen regulatory protein PII n=1 Tax=Candidatus Scalindua japonica TaxID=1284222 RepID=A0A286TTG1_9BACT|nr:P-II family nitrogen regulator [Candidatus Scalindua japonica]GAX59158.1 nitrogen regulatory protein PII [Candidatus Scalindua japonica]
MEKIEAVIRPQRFMAVSSMLYEIGIISMNISEIRGHGNEIGALQMWRGREYKVDMHEKIKIEIVVSEVDVESVVNIILREAKTGATGDGRIFITHIESAYRIRSGEKWEDAANAATKKRVVKMPPKKQKEVSAMVKYSETEGVF